jgi:hypothetical protein
MTIPITALHVLRVMMQIDENLTGLQRDMRNNALTWKAQAQAQTIPVTGIAGYMNDAAVSYQSRLAWLDTLQADSATWSKISAMWAMLGGTAQDFSDLITPISAVANQLGPATKTTYAQVIGVCDQITTAINAPLSLWPE